MNKEGKYSTHKDMVKMYRNMYTLKYTPVQSSVLLYVNTRFVEGFHTFN